MSDYPSVGTSSADLRQKSEVIGGVSDHTKHVDGAVSSEDAGAGLEIGGGAQ